MNKLLLGVSLGLSMCCLSCGDRNNAQNATDTRQISEDERIVGLQSVDCDSVAGLGEMRVVTYNGILPAASCSGIDYRLTIRSREHSGDGTFELRLTYLNADGRKNRTFTYTGNRFTLRGIPGNDNATVWQCISEEDKQIFNFLREDEDRLILLDSDFGKPDSNLNCSLTRIAGFL